MKTVRSVLAVFFAVLGVACGGKDSPTGPINPFVGTYSLVQVGGVAPPAIITVSGTSVVIHGVTLTISSGNAYTQTAVVETTSGISTITDHGTVAWTSTLITLTSTDDGSVVNGGWAGNAISLTDGGYLWGYLK